MPNSVKTFLLITLFSLFSNLAWPQDREMPQNYMMEKHGVSNPFYCDLEDAIEEIACMAWDTALGGMMSIQSQGDNDFKFDFDDFKTLASISALNKIQQDISGLRNYVYLENGYGGYTQSVCLLQKRGSCGNQQLALEKVLNYLGVKNRRIGIYMKQRGRRLSHAMNEVFLHDKWMLLDATNGSIYQRNKYLSSILSFSELRRIDINDRLKFRISNKNDILNRVTSHEVMSHSDLAREQFAYLDDDTSILGVLYDNQGTTRIDLDSAKPFLQLPNYIGANSSENNGITGIISSNNFANNITINLNVSGVGGCSSHGSVLVDENGNEFPLVEGDNLINISNGATFSTKRDAGEVCYIVFGGISLAQ